MKSQIITSLLLCATLSFSMGKSPQSFDKYPTLWEKAEKFASKGQYQSALATVDEIYFKAKSEDNTEQWYKAFIYRLRWTVELKEDGWLAGIAEAETWCLESEPEVKYLMALEMARQYHDYLRAFAYQIDQRSYHDQQGESDKQTWSSAQWVREILSFLETSLEGVNDLADEPVNKYLEIIEEKRKKDFPNSFLADIVLKENINLLSQLKMRYGDQVSEIETFLSSLEAQIDSRKQSLRLQKQFDKYLDLEYQWLESGLRDYSKKERKTVFEQAIQNTRGYTAEAFARYRNIIHQLDQERISKKEAHELLSKIVKDQPDSRGAKESIAFIKNTLEYKELQFQSESVWVPGTPQLISIHSRNIDQLNIYLAQVNYGDHLEQDNNYNDQLKFIRGLNYQLIDEIDLSFYNDYESHRVEVSIPGQDRGEYVLVVSQRHPSRANQYAAYSFVHVSQLAPLHINHQGAVVDRSSGLPIRNVDVRYYKREYNRRSFEIKQIAQATTNKDGRYDLVNINEGLVAKYEYNGDVLFMPQSGHYNHSRSYNNRSRAGGVFFLDRAIYRPGQRVKFKLTLYQSQGVSKELMRFQEEEISLHDVNGKKVDQLLLKTNMFGTAYGEFVLPKTVLPGQFSLRGKSFNGWTQVAVEEYKRPQLEADFAIDTLLKVLGDNITQELMVKSYYGVSIANAKVQYRVTEAERLPYYFNSRGYYGCYWPIRNIEKEIITGETKTDESGRARVEFPTKPSKNKYHGLSPNKSYRIYATIIDPTGEAIDINKTILIGNSPYHISGLSEWSGSTSQEVSIPVTIKNYDGHDVAVDVEIQWHKLTEPNRGPFVQRYWPMPDSILINDNDFKSNFPNFSLKTEAAPSFWKKEMIKRTEVNLTTGNKVQLKEGSPGAGSYQLNILDDHRQVVFTSFIQIYDEVAGVLPKGFEGDLFQKSPLISGTNTWRILSKWRDINPYMIDHQMNLQRCGARPQFVLDRSNINQAFITTAYVKHNRFFELAEVLDWKKDQFLNVEIVDGFEEKVEPGAAVKWKVKVTDKDGKPVKGELIATAYDQSLDAYRSLNWPMHQLKWSQGYMAHIQSVGFRSDYGRTFRYNPERVEVDRLEEPRLLHFPLIYGGRVMMRNAQPEAEDAVMLDEVSAGLGATKKAKYDGNAFDSEKAEESNSDDRDGSDSNGNVRKKLIENPLFLGMLQTDEQGRGVIEFEASESLGKWKLLLASLDKELKIGQMENTFVTSKELLVEPFLTRFFHSGDESQISARISNSSSQDINATTRLRLFDAGDGKEISYWIINSSQNVPVGESQSAVVHFTINIPDDYHGVVKYLLEGSSDAFMDAQEGYIPVLQNKIHVVEGSSIYLASEDNRTYKLNDLGFNFSSEYANESTKIEVVDQPLWYVFKTLPYIGEKENPSITDLANSWVVNHLGRWSLENHPWLGRVVQEMPDQSALQRNKDVRNVPLELTPFLNNAENEAVNFSLFRNYYNPDKIDAQLQEVYRELRSRQNPSGGFSWMPGGRDSWYMSQTVLDAIVMLKDQINLDVSNEEWVLQLFRYCEEELQKSYRRDIKHGLDRHYVSFTIMQFLLAKSILYPENDFSKEEEFYWSHLSLKWAKYSINYQAVIAEILRLRNDDKELLNDIKKSFDERLINGEDRGLFWKYGSGMRYSDNGVWIHSKLMRWYCAMDDDKEKLDGLMNWLIQNKRTQSWDSKMSSIQAIYSILQAYGDRDDQLHQSKPVEVLINKKPLELDSYVGAGNRVVQLDNILEETSELSARNSNDHIAWVNVYRSYDSPIDAVQSAKGDVLSLKRSWLKKDQKSKWIPLKEADELSKGDRIVVRLEITTDRDMEYVSLRDSRPAGMDPGVQLSGYQWKNGLNYYVASRDLSMDIFIDQLPRGTHVIEYDLQVTHSGNYTTGLAQLECMYAPEFKSHSQGQRVVIR